MNEFYKVLKLLGKFSTLNSDSDSGKSLEEEIVNRDRKYTELLDNYLMITKRRNNIKEFHKWLFFWIVILLCFIIIYLVYKTINYLLSAKDYSIMLQAIPIFITAFASCITAIIAIPITITNFLFNTKEDDNIAKIIQHMQDHDMAGMSLFKERFKDKAEKNIKFTNSDQE